MLLNMEFFLGFRNGDASKTVLCGQSAISATKLKIRKIPLNFKELSFRGQGFPARARVTAAAQAASVYVEAQGQNKTVRQADVQNGSKRAVGGWKKWSDTAQQAALNNTVTVESGERRVSFQPLC